VIDAFGRGFETVLSRISLIALPVFLDLFLWLGPQLSVAPLTAELGTLLEDQLQAAELPVEMYQAVQTTLERSGENLNVFGFLSTSPLGVPSMMVASGSRGTPLGSELRIPITTGGSLFILSVGLNITGLFLAAVFFGMIARDVLPVDDRWSEEQNLERLWFSWVRLLGFGASLLLAMFLLGLLIAVLSTLLSLLHPFLGGVATSLGIALWIWTLLFVAFTVHGVVMHNFALLPALRKSIRLVRWNMSAVTGLFIIVLILSWGLGFLLSMPSRESWLLLAAIVAHGFVASGVVASTFHFYQDRLRWCDEMDGMRLKEHDRSPDREHTHILEEGKSGASTKEE